MRSKKWWIVFTIILVVVLTYGFSSSGDIHEAKFVYADPKGKEEEQIKKLLIDSNIPNDTVNYINASYKLPQPLNLEFGASIGPLFDPENNTIHIPYDFINHIGALFASDGQKIPQEELNTYTLDVLLNVLYHEIGHALIAIYDLPVLGKEEDAADALASMLLIKNYESGDEIVFSASAYFDLLNRNAEIFEEDFWDEHSLNVQRFFTLLCHMYGSNPKKYAKMAQDIGFSEERAAMCESDFYRLNASWDKLLSPHKRFSLSSLF